jgi:hypothetical protein
VIPRGHQTVRKGGQWAVYYRTRLQPTIAQSSTEAEFTNMADAGKAAVYLRWLLEEIGIIMDAPTPILADNQGAVRLANLYVSHTMSETDNIN